MLAIFQPRIAKKINMALSVSLIVISSYHRLLWWDSYKGVGLASTLPESKLHKIIIITQQKKLVCHNKDPCIARNKLFNLNTLTDSLRCGTDYSNTLSKYENVDFTTIPATESCV